MVVPTDDFLSKKIEETHEMVERILENTSSLKSLDSIALTLLDVKTALLTAAIGKDQVPLSVVQSLFKMWGTVIFALLLILVFLLTGKAFGWFNLIPT